MRYLFASLILLLPAPLFAQDKKKPGDEMIEKYLAAETDKLSAKFLDGAKTLEEWKEKRPRLYQEYMDMLGLWPLPEKTPLKAVKTGALEAHGVVVEMIHFQSKPGLYVTANVYRPKDAAGAKRKQCPAIVYASGHSARGRDGNKTAFQDHGFWFANNGYVCIILDSLQLGEIPGVHHGTYGTPWRHIKGKDKTENRFWWHSIGYSPAAVECWNGIRAIDYLCTRSDVDPERIGVTGISGGGAATFWIAAADPRVKVAVPVSGMGDLEFYVKQKGINSHCDCMFLYNTYQWDWTTIAALIAPRPMLFANSDKDPIFPMDANRRIYTKLQKIYGMYAKPQDKRSVPGGPIEEHISPGGHDYRPDLRLAVFQFFNKHLKGDAAAKIEDSAKYTPLDGRKLRVFPTDDDVPADAKNGRIDELFVPLGPIPLPDVVSPKGEKFDQWKARRVARLEEVIFRKEPAEIRNAAMWTVPLAVGRGTGRTIFLVSFDEFNDMAKREDMVKRFAPKRETYVFDLPRSYSTVDMRGKDTEERYTWTAKSPPNCFERSHLLVGRTMDELRLLHFRNTVGKVSKYFSNGPVRVVGTGQNGILAAYAALFEPSIKEVIVIDPPKSHKEGPYFLNVMRVLDIPEALGLLAPTPLTIIGGKDAAFDRTEAIYKLAGAGEKLKRK